VVGSDPNTDVALLKIDAGRPLAALQFGDSDAIEVGDWAIAIGNPFGNLEGSLTVGVVSAKGRSDLVIVGGTPRYQDFIQTDASINFGNSGGPLVGIDGRVIGINTAVNAGGQGIGFAIPGNLARRVYDQLREHGRVVRGYLGVQTETPQAAAAGADAEVPAAGAQVTSVLPDSPAARAGLSEGDLIVEFDGHAVRDSRELQFLVAETAPGREVRCEFQRGGRRQSATVVLVELGAGRNPAAAAGPAEWLGMTVAGMTDPSPRVRELKETFGLTGDRGVIVTDVTAGGAAARGGIKPGDVVLEMDGRTVAGPNDYQDAAARAIDREQPVRLLVRSGKEENYVLLQPRQPAAEE
jgi:S1-C subfamily serine protease